MAESSGNEYAAQKNVPENIEFSHATADLRALLLSNNAVSRLSVDGLYDPSRWDVLAIAVPFTTPLQLTLRALQMQVAIKSPAFNGRAGTATLVANLDVYVGRLRSLRLTLNATKPDQLAEVPIKSVQESAAIVDQVRYIIERRKEQEPGDTPLDVLAFLPVASYPYDRETSDQLAKLRVQAAQHDAAKLRDTLARFEEAAIVSTAYDAQQECLLLVGRHFCGAGYQGKGAHIGTMREAHFAAPFLLADQERGSGASANVHFATAVNGPPYGTALYRPTGQTCMRELLAAVPNVREALRGGDSTVLTEATNPLQYTGRLNDVDGDLSTFGYGHGEAEREMAERFPGRALAAHGSREQYNLVPVNQTYATSNSAEHRAQAAAFLGSMGQPNTTVHRWFDVRLPALVQPPSSSRLTKTPHQNASPYALRPPPCAQRPTLQSFALLIALTVPGGHGAEQT